MVHLTPVSPTFYEERPNLQYIKSKKACNTLFLWFNVANQLEKFQSDSYKLNIFPYSTQLT